MTMRTRKLIGTIILFIVIPLYALLAMVVAVSLEVNTTSKWIELVFYVVAGTLWVLPAGFIIQWMSRGDPE
ncbi:MAG: DUF2842 domain-containing protein [Filomicrobium sp.]